MDTDSYMHSLLVPILCAVIETLQPEGHYAANKIGSASRTKNLTECPLFWRWAHSTQKETRIPLRKGGSFMLWPIFCRKNRLIRLIH